MRVPAFFAALLVAAASVGAHDFAFTDVRLEVRADGAWLADVRCDVDALALGVSATADSAALAAEIEALSPADRDALVARLATIVARRIRVRFDGEPAPFETTLPEKGRPRGPGELPSALGLFVRLAGRVPEGARHVTFFASRAFPPVRLVVVRPGEVSGPVEVVTSGAESRPVALAGERSPVTAGETFRRFAVLGVTHILPYGLDHVLFVVGLALLSPRLRPLLAQVTAFTLAHTLTLALSSYGVVTLPSRLVEPLIALSIAYVGVENAVSPRLRPSRLALVFAFGLLHGLGFAGVLAEMGLPDRHRLAALLAFNVGVEIGQLAVIGLALGALALWALAGRSRQVVVRPVSLGIAAIGLLWTVQRAAGL
jgi:HupE / UreJ protein